ncbi:predicted protein [Naegleria gruberi]|uniref:Predicted protein n=1 Tax=Naegleria gruberi TaxID=5762 RepID=D2VKU3_NAEGR|nr:uncharacterized protein NAEGRDRAFT_50392 [Naegleria gruberi]EFC42500.1 predicted protein [Naegleria gruberi]|eukprot:XP_002675244.1 predicted protein [Naegleria gruberi strain NEG-M]
MELRTQRSKKKMKILCLDKGLGFSFKQHLLKYYKDRRSLVVEEINLNSFRSILLENNSNEVNDELFAALDMKIVTVSEPTSSNDDYEEDESFMNSITLIEKTIKEYQPDILLCSSRGGKYIGKLMKDLIWNGPCVLISALIVPSMMDLNSCSTAMIFAYGYEEKTVPRPIMEFIKAFPNNKIVLLSYENEDHHMSSLIQLDLMLKEDWMNTALENVCQPVSNYRNASNDSVFENKKLSLLELIILSIVISKIEKRNISKSNLPNSGTTDSKPSTMRMGNMLSPSMLKGGLGGLRKVQKE